MTEHQQAARAGLERAMARAKKVVAAASVVAALTPLSALAAPNVYATFNQQDLGSGIIQYRYTIFNCGSGGTFSTGSGGFCSTTGGGPAVFQFTIPELTLGDLRPSGIPAGWLVSEDTTPDTPGAVVPGYTPAAYLNVFYPLGEGTNFVLGEDTNAVLQPTDGIPTGQSRTFTFLSGFIDTVEADFAGADGGGDQFLVDPLVPLSVNANAIPEPSSVAALGLGLAALVGLRRRKRR